MHTYVHIYIYIYQESSQDTIWLRHGDDSRWEFFEVLGVQTNRSLGKARSLIVIIIIISSSSSSTTTTTININIKAVLTSSKSPIPGDTFFQTITGGNQARPCENMV